MAKSATADNEAQAGVEFEDNDSYTFNMKETEEDSGFAPLPKGTYPVTIEKCEFKLSASSGNPMWNLQYAVTGDSEFAQQNRKVFDIISLQPKMYGQVKRFINRVAPELSELEDFNPKKVAEEGLLIGKELRVRLDIENDETYGARNRVKDRLAAGGAGGASFNMG